MLNFCSLYSGSSGNSLFVETENTKILIDAGMSCKKIEEALTHMGEAIHKNIRKVDVCTRYSAMQYLIILSQPTEAEIPNIMTRIFMQYYKLQDSQNFTPTYEYITMKD